MTGRIQRQERLIKFPRIGQIKTGEVVKNLDGKDHAKGLDYFLPTGFYAGMFTEVFGKRPQKIEILFLSDDLSEVCNERYELWCGKKMYGRGDGYNFSIWDKDKRCSVDYQIDNTEKDEFLNKTELEAQKYNKSASWSVVLTLRFYIPAIRGVLGVWEFNTRAEASSIPQIVTVFDIVQELAGSVLNIPFDLHLTWATSKKMEDKSAYPVVSLISNVNRKNLSSMKELRANNAALPLVVNDVLIEEQINKRIDYCIDESNKKTVQDAEYSVSNDRKNNISLIDQLYNSCETFNQLNIVMKKIDTMALSDDEKKYADTKRIKTVQKLRDVISTPA